MKITTQEEYGLRCLLRLARARDERPLTIPEIAAAEGFSVPYVGKLLSVLRQAGLIESVRGRTGGYRLSVAPSSIGLGTILLALGEPLYDSADFCRRHAGTETHGDCIHRDGCNLRALWQTLEDWLRHALDRITLADLLQHEGRFAAFVRSRLAELATDSLPVIDLV